MIKKSYLGFKVRQRDNDTAINFFVFVANAKDILEWSTVDRLEERHGGIQRRVSEARLRAMTRYFELNNENVIPTGIVIAFKPDIARFLKLQNDNLAIDSAIQLGTLTFEYERDSPPQEKPALIVDGQHRLLGMARVEGEELPVLVSALLDAESTEQAFQFVVINNKVTRVPSDLVRSLIVDFNEDALQERLKTARVSLRQQALLVAIFDDEPESPFYQMISWERRRGEGIPSIKPAAIEDSLRYVRRRLLVFDEDQDGLVDFFFAIWHGVKKAYPELWEETKNRLFENAGFKAFSEFMVDQIEAFAGIDYLDIYDTDEVMDATKKIASQIDIGFWLSDWKLKSLDTSAGREVIKNDIAQIRQNRKEDRSWYEELTLVDSQAMS